MLALLGLSRRMSIALVYMGMVLECPWAALEGQVFHPVLQLRAYFQTLLWKRYPDIDVCIRRVYMRVPHAYILQNSFECRDELMARFPQKQTAQWFNCSIAIRSLLAHTLTLSFGGRGSLATTGYVSWQACPAYLATRTPQAPRHPWPVC